MKVLSTLTAFGLVLAAGGALAQTAEVQPATGGTTTTAEGTTATNPNDGSFSQMSPGNQKITEALFNAQKSGTTTTVTGTGTTTTTQSGPQAMSLDDIAARKQDGQGFGTIFKDMKSEGLIDAKNLGQVVSGKAGQTTTPTDPGTVSETGASATQTSTLSGGRKTATVVTLGDGTTTSATSRTHGRSSQPEPGKTTTGVNRSSGGQGGKHGAGVTTAGGGAAAGGGQAHGRAHGGSGGNAAAGMTTAAGAGGAIGNAGGHGGQGGKTHGGGNGRGK